jgi:uncharacterized protein DUF4436
MSVPETRSRRARPLLIAATALAVIIAIVAYVLVINSFSSDAKKQSRPFLSGENIEDGILVDATVLSVDPAKGEMTVRLEFEPKGSFAGEAGELTQPVNLLVSSTTNTTRTFEPGKLMSPTDVNLSLFDGQVTSYPFDKYKAELEIEMSVAGANLAQQETVPTTVGVIAAVHGFRIDPSNAKGSQADHFINLHVKRAVSTLFFAIFVMALLWALALAALAVSLILTFLHREIPVPIFAFFAALLFAFPAIRNALPGTPPIGSLDDYIAFFWTEAIVAVALLVVVTVWTIRQARPNRQ